ncbi:MAG: NAD-dependent epimerase/dehydratase family protein [Acidobacteriota bacterium]
MKLLVTGGTGFLGKRLCFALHRKGYKLRIVARDITKIKDFPEELEIVFGDIRDREIINKTIDGIDGILHLAALVKSWVKNKKEYYEINVQALQNLLNICEQKKLKFLYVSTFFVSGPTGDKIFNEDDFKERVKFFNEYERTKYLGYEISKIHKKKGNPIIIVFPGIIYGPGELTDGNFIVKLILDHIQGNLPGMIGKGKYLWNFVYVDDVVEGIISAWEKEKFGEEFILGGENTLNKNVFEILEKYTGIKPPKLKIPPAIAYSFGIVQYLYSEITNKQPKFIHRDVKLLTKNWAYSSEKAEKLLDYKWRSLEEGLKDTIEWIQDEVIKLNDER